MAIANISTQTKETMRGIETVRLPAVLWTNQTACPEILNVEYFQNITFLTQTLRIRKVRGMLPMLLISNNRVQMWNDLIKCQEFKKSIL